MADPGVARRRWRRRVLAACVAALYAATWAGGSASHSRRLTAETWDAYSRAEARQAKYLLWMDEVPIYAQVHADGPAAGIDWCVPLLPGVLIVHDHRHIGPLYARGELKLVAWYGLGSVEMARSLSWIS